MENNYVHDDPLLKRDTHPLKYAKLRNRLQYGDESLIMF